MGKAEYFKLERRFLKEQEEVSKGNKDYRNKIFLAGFLSGCVVTAIVGAIFFQNRGPATATNVPKIATGGALPSSIALPSNLNLNEPAASPLKLQP